jgi:peptidyl-prolyl cis-trans isomerase C
MNQTLKPISALCCEAIFCGAICLGTSAWAQAIGANKEAQAALAQSFVTVNGEIQSNARAEVLLREQMGRGIADSADLRKGVREQLINQAVMAQQARLAGMEQDPLVLAQIELARQTILSLAWQQKVLSEVVVKPEDLKSEYDRQIIRLGKQEYLVRHLLVADESTAKLLIEKLQSGARMADVAGEYSRDASTQQRGGLTDWTVITNFFPSVAEVVAKLDKGKLWAQPVRSDAGWHVLQLEDKRAFTPPTFEALKPQLVQIIARGALEARAQTLKTQARVE